MDKLSKKEEICEWLTDNDVAYRHMDDGDALTFIDLLYDVREDASFVTVSLSFSRGKLRSLNMGEGGPWQSCESLTLEDGENGFILAGQAS